MVMRNVRQQNQLKPVTSVIVQPQHTVIHSGADLNYVPSNVRGDNFKFPVVVQKIDEEMKSDEEFDDLEATLIEDLGCST